MTNIGTPRWYDEVIDLYNRYGGSLEEDIREYVDTGYVFVTDEFILLGKQIDHGWYVYLAAGRGSLRAIIGCMPYYLPYVSWARPRKGRPEPKWIKTERLLSYVPEQ